MVNAVLDALLAGEAVRVSGLGVFNVAARPAREGRNPRTGESIEIAASKAVRFHAGKAVKDALNPPAPRRLPGRSLNHQRNPRCGSKRPLDVRRAGTATSSLAISRDASSGISRLAGAAQWVSALTDDTLLLKLHA